MANKFKKNGFLQHVNITRNDDEVSKPDENFKQAVGHNVSELLVFEADESSMNEDASLHMTVMGSTGSGRNASIMLPVLNLCGGYS